METSICRGSQDRHSSNSLLNFGFLLHCKLQPNLHIEKSHRNHRKYCLLEFRLKQGLDPCEYMMTPNAMEHVRSALLAD